MCTMEKVNCSIQGFQAGDAATQRPRPNALLYEVMRYLCVYKLYMTRRERVPKSKVVRPNPVGLGLVGGGVLRF